MSAIDAVVSDLVRRSARGSSWRPLEFVHLGNPHCPGSPRVSSPLDLGHLAPHGLLLRSCSGWDPGSGILRASCLDHSAARHDLGRRARPQVAEIGKFAKV